MTLRHSFLCCGALRMRLGVGKLTLGKRALNFTLFSKMYYIVWIQISLLQLQIEFSKSSLALPYGRPNSHDLAWLNENHKIVLFSWHASHSHYYYSREEYSFSCLFFFIHMLPNNSQPLIRAMGLWVEKGIIELNGLWWDTMGKIRLV